MHLIREMGQIGAFGPFIPEEYGGPGLDYISCGLIMQELERGTPAIGCFGLTEPNHGPDPDSMKRTRSKHPTGSCPISRNHLVHLNGLDLRK